MSEVLKEGPEVATVRRVVSPVLPQPSEECTTLPPDGAGAAGGSEPTDNSIQRQIDDAVEEDMQAWRGAMQKGDPHAYIAVASEVERRNHFRELENAKRGLSPHDVVAQPVQTLPTFLARNLPPKDTLIEGLLYRRDIVALAGRRRHGKTTFTGNLTLALTLHHPNFLGYRIPAPAKVLALYLEDDAAELQLKMRRMCRDTPPNELLALYTREDFYRANTSIDVTNDQFKRFVVERCSSHHPDVIILDNLAHLIGADYNNPKLIHHLIRFVWQLSTDLNAAIIILAHPRKRDKKLDSKGSRYTARLRDDPEGFFEEVMGSSHFVNSCGSLWAIERDMNTNETDFLGGTQRLTGRQTLMTLDKDENDWLRPTTDMERNLELAQNTPSRRTAWALLPDTTFTYTEAEKSVKFAMKSSSTFNEWFNLLKHLRLVVPEREGYRKATLTQL